MTTLYFNSNYPRNYQGNLNGIFDSLMLKFILLTEDNMLQLNKFIATSKSPSEISVCEKTLKNLIDEFKINELNKYKDYRKKLYSYFTKFPIDADTDVQDVFSEDEINSSIEFDGRDATDLFIAKKLNYYIMSLPLSESFTVNNLNILIDGEIVSNINWYGSNTKYLVENLIEDNEIENSNLSILKYSFDDYECLMSESFKSNFIEHQLELQKFIIGLFSKALNSNLLFPSRGDDNIVKKCEYVNNVYELRNHAFGGIRVYFRCIDNKILLGNLGFKSSYNQKKIQSNDIVRSEKELDDLESSLISY